MKNAAELGRSDYPAVGDRLQGVKRTSMSEEDIRLRGHHGDVRGGGHRTSEDVRGGRQRMTDIRGRQRRTSEEDLTGTSEEDVRGCQKRTSEDLRGRQRMTDVRGRHSNKRHRLTLTRLIPALQELHRRPIESRIKYQIGRYISKRCMYSDHNISQT